MADCSFYDTTYYLVVWLGDMVSGLFSNWLNIETVWVSGGNHLLNFDSLQKVIWLFSKFKLTFRGCLRNEVCIANWFNFLINIYGTKLLAVINGIWASYNSTVWS